MLGKFIGHCEDSLTASVFTHLLHLPAESFWQILRGACYSQALPKNPGEPQHVEAWPSWSAKGTSNADRVIPDFFIRFAEFDLIIEAKRWDDRMQNRAQWQNELKAYTNEFGEEMRAVRMIALGGLHGTEDEELREQWFAEEADPSSATGTHLFECPISMCRWAAILDQCKRMKREIGRLEYTTATILAAARTLDDLIDLFGWHGFSTGVWFNDLEFANNRLGPAIDAHLRLFTGRSLELISN